MSNTVKPVILIKVVDGYIDTEQSSLLKKRIIEETDDQYHVVVISHSYLANSVEMEVHGIHKNNSNK